MFSILWSEPLLQLIGKLPLSYAHLRVQPVGTGNGEQKG